jgi:hypothetical protein
MARSSQAFAVRRRTAVLQVSGVDLAVRHTVLANSAAIVATQGGAIVRKVHAHPPEFACFAHVLSKLMVVVSPSQ